MNIYTWHADRLRSGQSSSFRRNHTQGRATTSHSRLYAHFFAAGRRHGSSSNASMRRRNHDISYIRSAGLLWDLKGTKPVRGAPCSTVASNAPDLKAKRLRTSGAQFSIISIATFVLGTVAAEDVVAYIASIVADDARALLCSTALC